nr:hypothetical protein [Anaerolineae bacterium]
LTRHLGLYYTTVVHINENLPPSAKILFLWEPRSYYCQRDCWPDALLDKFKHLTYKYHDAEGIAEYLHREGVTHLLLYQTGLEHILEAGFDPITPDDVATLTALQEDHLRLIHDEGGAYLLYELK